MAAGYTAANYTKAVAEYLNDVATSPKSPPLVKNVVQLIVGNNPGMFRMVDSVPTSADKTDSILVYLENKNMYYVHPYVEISVKYPSVTLEGAVCLLLFAREYDTASPEIRGSVLAICGVLGSIAAIGGKNFQFKELGSAFPTFCMPVFATDGSLEQRKRNAQIFFNFHANMLRTVNEGEGSLRMQELVYAYGLPLSQSLVTEPLKVLRDLEPSERQRLSTAVKARVANLDEWLVQWGAGNGTAWEKQGTSPRPTESGKEYSLLDLMEALYAKKQDTFPNGIPTTEKIRYSRVKNMGIYTSDPKTWAASDLRKEAMQLSQGTSLEKGVIAELYLLTLT